MTATECNIPTQKESDVQDPLSALYTPPEQNGRNGTDGNNGTRIRYPLCDKPPRLDEWQTQLLSRILDWQSPKIISWVEERTRLYAEENVIFWNDENCRFAAILDNEIWRLRDFIPEIKNRPINREKATQEYFEIMAFIDVAAYFSEQRKE